LSILESLFNVLEVAVFYHRLRGSAALLRWQAKSMEKRGFWPPVDYRGSKSPFPKCTVGNWTFRPFVSSPLHLFNVSCLFS